MTDSRFSVNQWSSETSLKPIGSYIARINQQWRSFRDVTELSLEQESTRFEDYAIRDDTESLDDTDETFFDEEGRKEMQRVKDQALLGINQAHTESAFSRDLVSLVLSISQYSQAQLTTSQLLKERIPPGSIGEDKVLLGSPEEGAQGRDEKMIGGLELQGLTSTVDSIVAAAERLENDIALEAHYWQDAIRIKERGWPICRTTRGDRNLGVYIGSVEAGAEHRRKGLVGLDKSLTGNIDLGLAKTAARSRRRLRVRVLRKGILLASTRVSNEYEGRENSVQRKLKDARDSLFDEELFYELSREASTLWTRGIKFTEDGILMIIDKETHIALDLINENDDNPIEIGDNKVEQKLLWPDAFAASLRILLCHSKRQDRKKRESHPRPLIVEKHFRHVPVLLSPLLLQMQRFSAFNDIERFVGSLQKTISNAEIKIEVHTIGTQGQFAKMAHSDTKHDGQSMVELLTEQISNPPQALFEIKFPTISTKIEIILRNQGNALECRYVIKETAADSSLRNIPLEMTFQDVFELQSAMLDVVRISLVEAVQKRVGKEKCQSLSPQTGEIQLKRTTNGDSIYSVRINISSSFLKIEYLKYDHRGVEPVQTWIVGGKSDEMVDVLSDLRRQTSTA